MTTHLEKLIDQHGPDWRTWILENLERGCAPLTMLRDMVNAVWTLAAAETALDEGLAILGLSSNWKSPMPTLPDADQFEIDGRTISVRGRFASPRAAMLEGILSAQECADLIDYARSKGLKPSSVVDDGTGESVAHHARTSSSIHFKRAESPLINQIEQRLADMTGWPVARGEGLQVLRYEPGQQYKPHFDWFDPAKTGAAVHLKRGGQRVATTVLYLASAEAGGGTRFPKAGTTVLPPVGGAIFFNDVNALGEPDEMSLHSGEPVLRGVKIVATYWQRQDEFA